MLLIGIKINIIKFVECDFVYGTDCLTCEVDKCLTCGNNKIIDIETANPACVGKQQWFVSTVMIDNLSIAFDHTP